MSFGFAAAAATVCDRLVAALDLTQRRAPLEERGALRGDDVVLTARSFAGPSVAYARVVTVAGAGLDVGNVVVVGRAGAGLPILGLDLVAVARGARDDTGLVVADLTGGPSSPFALRPPPSPLMDAGALPAWAARWFSAAALFGRVRSMDAHVVPLLLDRYVDGFVSAARMASVRDDDVAADEERWRAYADDHRAEDRGLQLLTTIFGAEAARTIIDDVMFPPRV